MEHIIDLIGGLGGVGGWHGGIKFRLLPIVAQPMKSTCNITSLKITRWSNRAERSRLGKKPKVLSQGHSASLCPELCPLQKHTENGTNKYHDTDLVPAREIVNTSTHVKRLLLAACDVCIGMVGIGSYVQTTSSECALSAGPCQ